jgi:TPP-dependent indolepyruvate ferredoxin oxidoreductase alpha subunit
MIVSEVTKLTVAQLVNRSSQLTGQQSEMISLELNAKYEIEINELCKYHAVKAEFTL